MIRLLSKKKAILFDMDGVLFDSGTAHAASFQEAFLEAGIPPIPYREIAGTRTEEAVLKALVIAGRSSDTDIIARVSSRKRELARANLPVDASIPDGCLECIRRLADQFQLVLTSSASRSTVDLFFQMSESRRYFSAVITAEDIRRSKPDPEIFFKGLEMTTATAAEVVVVEDSANGIRAAKAAGLDVIAIVGTETRAALDKLSPTVIIASLGELLV
jgi:HAD superfamily hydrolase (TIGR01509 family)